jgi:preprotein translocase subunit YajC
MKKVLNSVLAVSSSILVSAFVGASAWAEGPAVPAGSAPTTGTPAAGGPNAMLAQVVPFALMFAVIYFLMIRPQQKKMREQQDMLKNLKVGDEVLTASGILGKISEITDKVVSVEVADRVRVKMLKSQITQVMKAGQV